MHPILRASVSGLHEEDKNVHPILSRPMKAMILESLGEVKPPQAPLRLVQRPEPEPAPGEVLLRVTRCGVCHTELDEIEGRTPPPQLPVVLGHQVIGIVESDSQLSENEQHTQRGTRTAGLRYRPARGRSLDCICLWSLPVLPIWAGKSLSRVQGNRTRYRRWLC